MSYIRTGTCIHLMAGSSAGRRSPSSGLSSIFDVPLAGCFTPLSGLSCEDDARELLSTSFLTDWCQCDATTMPFKLAEAAGMRKCCRSGSTPRQSCQLYLKQRKGIKPEKCLGSQVPPMCATSEKHMLVLLWRSMHARRFSYSKAMSQTIFIGMHGEASAD